MRVVLIDAFGQVSAKERRLWEEFELSCRKALAAIDIGEIRVDIIDKQEVKRFIYVNDDLECGTKGLTEFDKVDLFLVGCESELFPWEKRGKAIYVLLKMCFFTKKPVFGSSGLAHFFAVVLASRGLDFKPLNGKQGSMLRDFDAHKFAAMVQCARRDVFLDDQTGDLFHYDFRRKIWIPYTSIGLRKKSRQYDIIHKHHAKLFEPKNKIYLGKSNETVCRTTSIFVTNSLLKDLPREFRVRSQPSWMLDARANLKSKHSYQVVGENATNPLIVKKDKIVVAHFDISSEYPETQQLLANFAVGIVEDLKQHGNLDLRSNVYLTVQSQTAKAEDGIPPAKPAQVTRVAKSELKTKALGVPKAACLFSQSTRKQHSVLRKNRSLEELKNSERPVSAFARASNFAQNANLHFIDAKKKPKRTSRQSQETNTREVERHNRPASAPKKMVRRASAAELLSAALKQKSKAPLFDHERYLPLEDILSNPLTPTHFLRAFSAKPDLYLAAHGGVVGVQTKSKSQKMQTKPNISKSPTKVPRIRIGETPIYGPTIRVDGPFETRYEEERRLYLEGKKKWVARKVFNPFVARKTMVEREEEIARKNLPQSHLSKPAALHKFREESKHVWMC